MIDKKIRQIDYYIFNMYKNYVKSTFSKKDFFPSIDFTKYFSNKTEFSFYYFTTKCHYFVTALVSRIFFQHLKEKCITKSCRIPHCAWFHDFFSRSFSKKSWNQQFLLKKLLKNDFTKFFFSECVWVTCSIPLVQFDLQWAKNSLKKHWFHPR